MSLIRRDQDRIHTLRTVFARPGHEPLDAVTFASGVLRQAQRSVRQQLATTGFVAARLLALLDVELGDPNVPTGEPVPAYVNHGRWLARCECGGVEYVDLERPIFMCLSCFNAEHGHAWRRVLLPRDADEIERALLARPDPSTRHWHPGETADDLELENADHHVRVAGGER